MSLRPRILPKARDQILRHLANPDSTLRSTGTEYFQGQLDVTTSHLRDASLYWVTADMAALAVSAGATLAAARWTPADRPSERGLIVWDGGIGHIPAHGTEVPVGACTWGTGPGGCVVGLWIARSSSANAMAARGLELMPELLPPLIPLMWFTLPDTADPQPLAVPEGWGKPVVAALASAWLLMQQPNLVDHTIERPDKSARRAYGRAGREDPYITIIDLRHLYIPASDDTDEELSGRHYRHRWVVSGHWRNQAYGPDRTLRRQQWIPSYTKGPDGAPLLITEKVNVWRR